MKNWADSNGKPHLENERLVMEDAPQVYFWMKKIFRYREKFYKSKKNRKRVIL